MYDFFYISTDTSIFFSFLTLKFNILYNFYNLFSLQYLHQHIFNHISFDTVLSLYEMKINSCCKKPEPFENLPIRKTFFDGSCLEIDHFVKRARMGYDRVGTYLKY